MTLNVFPTVLSLRFIGVSKSSCESKRCAMLPTSVSIPVATTTPTPLPYVTIEDVYAILLRSPNTHSLGKIVSESFSDGTDSPVKEAS